MNSPLRWASVYLTVSLLGATSVASAQIQEPVQAQEQVQPPYQQVISANPFGILLDFFNAEYERVITESSTAGVGGSYYSGDEEDYLNADLFWRFYPGGTPLDGWAFGVKTGITNVPDQGTYFGLGFDANWSWLLGSRENFYVGLGFGLKRLYGVDAEELELEYIPTFRVVNIGIAF